MAVTERHGCVKGGQVLCHLQIESERNSILFVNHSRNKKRKHSDLDRIIIFVTIITFDVHGYR